MTTVLVVDDEPQIVRALGASLRAQGYRVVSAATGEEGIAAAAAAPPDLVVLDLGLPDLDGVDVLKRLRAWSSVPVVVLSVREAQADKVAALDAGADDYLSKPFGIEELLARMRAALRRAPSSGGGQPVQRFGDLEIDRERRTVALSGRALHLTPTEYALLEAMTGQPGKLLTHVWLLRTVWGPAYGDESHYLRVYVRQLRRKLGDSAAAPRFIATEPGIGYRWLAEPEPVAAQERPERGEGA
ncbi:MAG TPA: response regulator [Actinomycetota bacterium]|jgi:two-component system KDP operon response regulator KdpE